MPNKLNANSINRLLAAGKNDLETLDFIKSCLESFEKYHKAVFDDQLFQLIYTGSALDGDNFREVRTAVDRTRTLNHNGLIANVRILNRMAEKAGIDPVYDGIVSEQQPYRRLLADAVFEYLDSIIDNRN